MKYIEYADGNLILWENGTLQCFFLRNGLKPGHYIKPITDRGAFQYRVRNESKNVSLGIGIKNNIKKINEEIIIDNNWYFNQLEKVKEHNKQFCTKRRLKELRHKAKHDRERELEIQLNSINPKKVDCLYENGELKPYSQEISTNSILFCGFG